MSSSPMRRPKLSDAARNYAKSVARSLVAQGIGTRRARQIALERAQRYEAGLRAPVRLPGIHAQK